MANLPVKGGGGGGGGADPITAEEQAFLDRWSYDAETDTDTLTSSFATKPSSVYLSKPFRLSNGVQAVSYTLADDTTAIGLINRYAAGGSRSNPNFFALEALENLNVNTDASTTLTGVIEVPYTTAGDNLTHDFMFRPASAGRLRFQIWLGTDATGARIFDEGRTVTQAEVDSGAPINFMVGNQYLLNSGTQVFGRFSGIDLLGSATQPYFVSQVHPFTNVQINGHVEHVSASVNPVFIGCDYEVDTTTAPVSLVVPLLFEDAFTVSDAGNTFSPTRACTVDFTAYGQGLFAMQTSRDSFKFHYDGSDWYFKNLDTKEGGIVVATTTEQKESGGFMDYNNNGAVQVLAADTWVTLDNTGLGPNTNKTYTPVGVTELLDVATGRLRFSDLNLGDEVVVRHTLEVTPNSNGQTFQLRHLVGTATYPLPVNIPSKMEQGGGTSTDDFTVESRIYMGDTNTLNGGALPQILVSGSSDVSYKGVYISVIRGGF